MKTLLSVLIVLFASHLLAQSPQMFVVHEDIVKPSKNALYNECMTKLKDLSVQHKSGFGWTSIGYNDNSYIHVAPMASFADLEKNPFADLESKADKEAMAKLWADFDNCIESHRDFVISYEEGFSYMSAPAEETYREITYWYPLPGKGAEAEEILKEWKNLYEGKKSPAGYAVYKVVFGNEPGYAIVSWAKDAVDLAMREQKSNELLGEEVGKLWAKTQTISKKYYSKKGWILTDVSYSMNTGTN